MCVLYRGPRCEVCSSLEPHLCESAWPSPAVAHQAAQPPRRCRAQVAEIVPHAEFG